jgi:hypothetical protein
LPRPANAIKKTPKNTVLVASQKGAQYWEVNISAKQPTTLEIELK